jgi:two-component system, NtrC family, sensor kinase
MNRFPVPLRLVALMLLTALIVCLGALNVRDRIYYRTPTDGAFWVETPGGLVASEVAAETPAAWAGIKAGDRLATIGGRAVRHLGDYADILFAHAPGDTVVYGLAAGGGSREVSLAIAGRSLFAPVDVLRAILAVVHLAIGVWVLFKSGGVPRAGHFYWICLSAFGVYLLSYTGKGDIVDGAVYGFSVGSFLLLPALFLHFCLRFPKESRGSHVSLAYAPGLVLAWTHLAWLTGHLAKYGLPLDAASSQLLDRVHLIYFCAAFVAAGAVLLRRQRHETDWVAGQQMRWVSYGTLAGIVPFGLLYGVPFLLGSRPGFALSASMLFLALVPLSFAYAVVRYRLGDVEVIARRGSAYFLASLLLLAGYLFVVLVIGRGLDRLVPQADFLVITAAALAIALLFAPLRSRIQERIDRAFFRERFHDRSTLLEFARMLGTQVSLPSLSSSILERISRTFDVPRAALYLPDPVHRGFFRLLGTVGSGLEGSPLRRAEEFESQRGDIGRASGQLCVASSELRSQGLSFLQDLCVRGRRIGVIALGKPAGRAEFSSEDLELLSALAGYAAIAIDNAGLYESVENKARELERLKLYTENILESIDVAVVALDVRGTVTSCNRAFEELYGIGRADICGHPVESVLTEDVVESIRSLTGADRWTVKDPAHLLRLQIANRRGDRLRVNLALIPLAGVAGQDEGSLVVLDDITEKARLEEQLQQVEKLSSLGLLAAGIAHEVNTPITGISSYTQMLLRQTSEGDASKAILEKIERQTFRAAEIVNGLLNFARVNGTEFTDLDLNRLIQDSLSLLEHQFHQGKIRVKSDLGAGLPQVYGNAGKLQQVFVNLFMNARDAMPRGGDLGIRTSMNDTMVVVEIKDSGVGISRENLQRIFDPFFTTKSTGRGTGLGLAVTYGILQDHGGRIFVDSEPGRGTCFTVKLPTRASAARES